MGEKGRRAYLTNHWQPLDLPRSAKRMMPRILLMNAQGKISTFCFLYLLIYPNHRPAAKRRDHARRLGIDAPLFMPPSRVSKRPAMADLARAAMRPRLMSDLDAHPVNRLSCLFLLFLPCYVPPTFLHLGHFATTPTFDSSVSPQQRHLFRESRARIATW